MGRNSTTGAGIQVPAKRVVKMKGGREDGEGARWEEAATGQRSELGWDLGWDCCPEWRGGRSARRILKETNSCSFLGFCPGELTDRLSDQDSGVDCAKFVLKSTQKDRNR